MPGIENTQKVLRAVVDIVTAEELLRTVDFGLLGDEILDADETELQRLVEEIKTLELNNDALEGKIKFYAEAGHRALAFALRILKSHLPRG